MFKSENKAAICQGLECFRRSAEVNRLSPAERNRKLFAEFFDRIEVSRTERLLVMSPDIAGDRGKIALYVRDDGLVKKAVLNDSELLHKLKLTEPSGLVRTPDGDEFLLFEELGRVANSSGYRAVKMPYTGAAWQPYKHTIVAVAFGLTDSVSYFDDWVVNHIGGRHMGDDLRNLEIVSHAENTAAGRVIASIRKDLTHVQSIYTSAKRGFALKYFKAVIKEVIKDEGRKCEYGDEYKIINVQRFDCKDTVIITGELYYSYVGINTELYLYRNNIQIELSI